MDAGRCTSGFYGRRSATVELTRWLDKSQIPVVVLDGPALTGKRRLAIEWGSSSH